MYINPIAFPVNQHPKQLGFGRLADAGMGSDGLPLELPEAARAVDHSCSFDE